MKKLFFTLFLLLLCNSFISVYADDVVIKGVKEPTENPDRPKAPARRLITATYDEGILYFTFAESALPAEVTVTNETSGDTWSMTATHSTGTLTVSMSHGLYHIEIVANNRTYEGEYTL